MAASALSVSSKALTFETTHVPSPFIGYFSNKSAPRTVSRPTETRLHIVLELWLLPFNFDHLLVWRMFPVPNSMHLITIPVSGPSWYTSWNGSIGFSSDKRRSVTRPVSPFCTCVPG